MAKYIDIPFAENGDKQTIPATTTDGTVNYTDGFGGDYARPLGTDPIAKPLKRENINQVLNDITGAVKDLQEHGVFTWQSTKSGGYDVGATVLYNGINYTNTVAGNTATPGATGSGWNGEVSTVTTVAGMIAIPNPSTDLTCIVTDNNQGGTFVYDSTQSEVNNGGTIFNGWVRQYSGDANVKWFGAKDIRDYPNYDSSNAFNKCIEAMAGIGGIECEPNGQYLCGTIKLLNKTNINFNNSIIFCKKDEKMFYNLTDVIQVTLKNVIIDMQGSTFTAVTNSYNGLYAIHIFYPNYCLFNNIKILHSPTLAFVLGDEINGSSNVPYLSKTYINNIKIEVTGMSNTADISDNKGLKIVSMEDIQITNCIINDCRGQGIHTVNCETIIVDNIITKNNTNGGVWLSYGTTNSTISNCNSQGDDNSAFGLNPGAYPRDISNGKPNKLVNSTAVTDGLGVAAIFGNFIIENNYFETGNAAIEGLWLTPAENKNFPDTVIIKNNTCKASTGNSKYGILFDTTSLTSLVTNYSNVYIENNIVDGYQNRGIAIITTNTVPTSNININGNTIRNTGQDCISLIQVNDLNIKNNIGYNTNGKYLVVINVCTVNEFSGNSINNDLVFFWSGTNTIAKVSNQYEMPFYQKVNLSATGDGNVTELTFAFSNMQSTPIFKSVYQKDADFRLWSVSDDSHSYMAKISFDSAVPKGAVKTFFFELALDSFSV